MPVTLQPGPGADLGPIPEDLTPQGFARLFRLTVQRAVEYLQGRSRLVPTLDWRDLWQEEHARAFTVSRLTRLDLVRAIHEKLLASVEGDLSRTDWTRDIRAALEEAGWWGRIEVVDTDTGEVLVTRFNPSRLRLIYEANVRSAHAVGRWERVQQAKGSHPYLRYITKRDERVRESHAQWDNVTLPVDDPFWETHYPPNGWRCRCRVTAVSQAAYERGTTPAGGRMVKERPPEQLVEWTDKRTGEVKQIPAGIDPGWGYNVGIAGARARELSETVDAKLAQAPPALADAAVADGLSAD